MTQQMDSLKTNTNLIFLKVRWMMITKTNKFKEKKKVVEFSKWTSEYFDEIFKNEIQYSRALLTALSYTLCANDSYFHFG